MGPTETLDAIRSWPLEARLELLFGLWDQVADAGWEPEVSAELAAELDRRLAAHVANPNNTRTWEDVVARVRRAR